MTPAFTVVHNPYITDSPASVAPRLVETGNAVGILTGRQFHVVGDLILDVLDYVDPYAGGVFVSGVRAQKRIARLRRDYPTVPMIVEPSAIREHWASEEYPFRLDVGENELFAPSLDAALDLQQLAGSDLVMTPTGQIRTGDSATLKAVLRSANGVDRTDLLLSLPFEAGWLSNEQLVTQIIRVIDRSRHPVALTFTHSSNPIESTKRLRAYRRIFVETTGVVLAYRTDLAGLDARAHGAIASAIGALPSARRLNPVGKHGFALDPEDLSPHMLIGDMLRFVRSTHMRRTWFAEAPSLCCFCSICRGAEIDRLHGSSEDRKLGHLHGVRELSRLHLSSIGLTSSELTRSWRAQVAGALDTYPQLETHTGSRIRIPNDLSVWAEPVA